MPKLAAGDMVPDFSFITPFESHRSLSETVGRVPGRTALIFLRYYGCTLCQYDIHRFAMAKDAIAAANGQLLVVLQSDPVRLAAQLRPVDLPFDLVCDPEQTLYRRFDIAPAPSKLKLADAGTVLKLVKVAASGFKHGAFEGDELQLPALFVMDTTRKITCARYGTSAGDVPSPEELVRLMV